MEPVTHILTGACLGRTGLNRRAAYTTLAMAVAAEFPDIDTVCSWRGPIVGFQHHRGITHTFLGIPFEAALIVAGIYGLHRWRVARARRALPAAVQPDPANRPLTKPLTAAPVRWGLLYAFTLLALLSHLWLDFTNNYGLRPFFPFNPRWYAASITFIFDPLMFAMLLAAILLPPLFRVVSAEVGARRQPFPARGWAVAALLGVCLLWGWRGLEHSRAVDLAMAQTFAQPSGGPVLPITDEASTQPDSPLPPEPPPVLLQPQRVLASPDPVNPWRWSTVSDFGPLYQLAAVDLRVGTSAASAKQVKLNTNPQLEAAIRSPLGRAYLDWSPMPFLSQDAGGAVRSVRFQDPRFLGDIPWLRLRGPQAPLTGVVELDPENRVIAERMDGKLQH